MAFTSYKNFTTPTGSNTRDSSIINERSLIKHLKDLDYTTHDLSQQWRYYIGKISKGDRSYFIKIATTEATNELLQNEVSFYKAIKEKIDTRIFNVQHVYETAANDDHFYYIAEWFDGEPLAKFQYKDSKISKDDIKRLAQIRFELDKANLSEETLHKDKISSDESKEIKNKAEKYIKIARDFSEEVPQDLTPLVTIVKQWQEDLELSFNHGSFEPRSLMKDPKGNYLLIDAEHASQFSPKYYDLAHCYVKLYCVAEIPDMAELLLDKYFEKAKLDREKEERHLNPAIASRLIGSYWDGVQEGVEDFSYRDLLFDDLQ